MKRVELVTSISCYEHVCKLIWKNSPPSHFIFGTTAP